LPERARDLPRRPIARPVARLVAHLTVVGLLAASAAVGLGASRGGQTSPVLRFDVVATARGADGGPQELRAATFVIQPDPSNADPLPYRRVAPTPTPAPSVHPATKAKPATTKVARAPAPAPVVQPYVPVVATGKLLWPVPGAVITQYFWAGHLAIDMATNAGNPVLAAGAGVVISAGWRDNGGGLVIEIDHGNGLHTLYNHLGAILVSTGQVVARGQRIANVGCTGLCTGPHVHFQVKVGGVFVNPLRYL
jgi:murein DD-endopeptidase MepM/ murein hydrolase activator NlpD